MVGSQFDALLHMLTHSRRSLATGMLTVVSGLLIGPRADARNRKRKNKKRKDKQAKPQPNVFGCLEVGDACTSEAQCCSGICKGQKGERRCRAHDTGTCAQDGPGTCSAQSDEMEPCNGEGSCSCFRTTAGSNACLEVGGAISTCSNCRTDADCLAMGLPLGSACVPVTEGVCDAFCQSDFACLAPCPVQATT